MASLSRSCSGSPRTRPPSGWTSGRRRQRLAAARGQAPGGRERYRIGARHRGVADAADARDGEGHRGAGLRRGGRRVGGDRIRGERGGGVLALAGADAHLRLGGLRIAGGPPRAGTGADGRGTTRAHGFIVPRPRGEPARLVRDTEGRLADRSDEASTRRSCSDLPLPGARRPTEAGRPGDTTRSARHSVRVGRAGVPLRGRPPAAGDLPRGVLRVGAVRVPRAVRSARVDHVTHYADVGDRGANGMVRWWPHARGTATRPARAGRPAVSSTGPPVPHHGRAYRPADPDRRAHPVRAVRGRAVPFAECVEKIWLDEVVHQCPGRDEPAVDGVSVTSGRGEIRRAGGRTHPRDRRP